MKSEQMSFYNPEEGTIQQTAPTEFIDEIKGRKVTRHFTMQNARIKLEADRKAGQVIGNRTALEKYCKSILKDEANESFHLLCVDTQCRLIGDFEISSGTLSEVSAYPRKIVTFAIMSNAYSVFLTHNHPGGTCHPSPEDIKSTEQIKSVLKSIGILTLDHMIVTPEGNAYSMAMHGDVNFLR